ncbi:acetyl-CoA carboxylase biotin carboxyl carrier protein, partial [bacterium]|nr:acetyl-CoA carboxylase biotin carboxyl carrier protein [bacterium]
VSPMVGTFYHSASPEAKPYKVSGDQVKAGDTVCIVEAMKVMNQIKAPKAGEIKRILVNNAEVVYKGQALMEIG